MGGEEESSLRCMCNVVCQKVFFWVQMGNVRVRVSVNGKETCAQYPEQNRNVENTLRVQSVIAMLLLHHAATR